ncbi:VanZ family protein [uncultured Ruthenibacterium sp.]|uniref:VanZ family protein n=1 Tax=uncultured Ruthenibacterium sp. TaxID=1905347 RepID=UPI00349EE397
MDAITVFQTLFRWGMLAFVGGLAVLFVLSWIYRIYKKAFHGKILFTKMQIICAGLLCCWFILVFCLTSLSRGSNFTGSFNVDFLSGYISAWNNWSISELQLIIFNMLMFAPLGFLLPLLWKKAEKFWVTLAVSFGVTALIELFQLFTGTGIFELDDLFHNLIGSLFGYFCIMAVLTSIYEKNIRFAPTAKALMIPCVLGLTLGVVFYIYDSQPYGNMSILPAVRQDVSAVHMVTELKFSEKDETAAVYKNRFAENHDYLENIKSALATLENLTFSNLTRREDENLGYLGTDANGTDFQMMFFFRTGEWSYTTFSETTAQITQEMAQRLRERYETWMQEMKLLPENANFSVQNGDTLRWDIPLEQDISSGCEAFQKGSVMIQFDQSGALANFFYQITWNEYVKTEKMISENQAYMQVESGNFKQYVPFQSGDILYINQCKLNYLYDTKGFYQPVYEFRGYINSSENLWVGQIPALAHEG